MTKQFPAKKRSIPKERSGLPQLEPTQAVTKDLAELPAGSAVLQCILSGDSFTVRSILIGAQEMDLLNPAHRFMRRLFDMIPQIMEDVNGGQFVAETNEQQLNEQLGGNPDAIHDAVVAAAEQMPVQEPVPGFTAFSGIGEKAEPLRGYGIGIGPDTDPEWDGRDAYVERADARTKQADEEATTDAHGNDIGTLPRESLPETWAASQQDALEHQQPIQGVDLADGPDASIVVYSSDNCVFNYCPHPEQCVNAPNGCVQSEFKDNAK